jgi:hypothetical protein
MFALQAHYGYLTDEAVAEAADLLGMTPMEVDELATFYTFIYREPVGTLRHPRLRQRGLLDGTVTNRWPPDAAGLGIAMGETTADGLFTLLPVCCIGYCDRAPAILINRKVYGPLTIIARLLRPILMSTLTCGMKAHPTSGNTLKSIPRFCLKNRKPDRIATREEYRPAAAMRPSSASCRKEAGRGAGGHQGCPVLLGRGGPDFRPASKCPPWPTMPRFRATWCATPTRWSRAPSRTGSCCMPTPTMLIEGMALTAFAIQAAQGIIFIRPEYESAARILEREIGGPGREAGYLGENILGSGFDFRHRRAPQRRALYLRRGHRPDERPHGPAAQPQAAAALSHRKGLWGQPTVLQNVETLCCVPHIVRNGGGVVQSLALTEAGAGTKLFCVSGRVNRPDATNCPWASASEIIEDHAGGMLPGSEFKACLPGGASTRFLTRGALRHIPWISIP